MNMLAPDTSPSNRKLEIYMYTKCIYIHVNYVYMYIYVHMLHLHTVYYNVCLHTPLVVFHHPIHFWGHNISTESCIICSIATWPTWPVILKVVWLSGNRKNIPLWITGLPLRSPFYSENSKKDLTISGNRYISPSNHKTKTNISLNNLHESKNSTSPTMP